MKGNESGSFLEMWMDLECVIQSEVSQKEKKMYINAYMWNIEKQYRLSYLQSRNRNTEIENKCMNTKGGRWGGWRNWGIEIDI